MAIHDRPTTTRYSGRSLVGGILFALAWLAFLAFHVAYPAPEGDDPVAILTAIQQNSGAHLLTIQLTLIFAALVVPGLLAIVSTVRGRGAWLTFVGSAFLGFAAIGESMQAVLNLMLRFLIASLNQTQTIDVMQHAGEYFLYAMPFLNLGLLGVPLLFGGLWRARLVPVWAFALALASVVIDVLPVPQAEVIGGIPLLIAMLWAAAAVVRAGASKSEADPEAVAPTQLRSALNG